MTRRRYPVASTVGLAALASLTGCATLGGNVKGSFSCQAPDGICAPSSIIDDRALGMISGDAGDTVIPAGPYQAPAQRPRSIRAAASTPAPLADQSAAGVSRTHEKVLRIVFQPYIDDRGRLHEASAVHTVVQSEWQAQALADATAIPDRNARVAQTSEVSLAEAVDRDAPGYLDVAAIDPNLPDPAVVAAARARRVDPVEAIKANVQSRIGRAGKARPTPNRSGTASPLASSAAPPSRTPPPPTVGLAKPSGVTAAGTQPSVPAGQRSASGPAAKTASGAEAVSRVKESERYVSAQERVEEVARNAGNAAPAASLKTLASPTIRAAGFPAAVPEDK